MTYIPQVIETKNGTFRTHIGLPHFVTKPGKYKTRCGEIVTVNSTTHRWAYGQYENGIKETWYTNGRIFSFSQSDNDIVSVA